MPAGDDEPQRGKCARRRFEQAGEKVRRDMVDTDERFAEAPRHRLRRARADEQRADETGTIAHRDGIEFLRRDARCGQRGANHRQNSFNVRAARDLGNDAFELLVKLMLRGDDVGKDLAAVAYDCGGSFVAA